MGKESILKGKTDKELKIQLGRDLARTDFKDYGKRPAKSITNTWFTFP